MPLDLTLPQSGKPDFAGTVISMDDQTTPNFVALPASSSQVIPAGAKGWTVSILTGTGTIGGLTVPAGFSDSDTDTTLVPITVTTNANSTAYVRWLT